ncbi:hypothetical protein ES708_28518 [subsurface metagenome]
MKSTMKTRIEQKKQEIMDQIQSYEAKKKERLCDLRKEIDEVHELANDVIDVLARQLELLTKIKTDPQPATPKPDKKPKPEKEKPNGRTPGS